MRSSLRTRFANLGLAFCVSGLLLVATTQGSLSKKSQAGNKVFWEPVCLRTNAGKLLGCRLVQRIFIKNRGKKGLLLAVQLRRPKGGKPYVYMNLPLGLSLPSGVVLAVMGNDKKPILSYRPALKTCVARGCVANMPLDRKLLAAMKKYKTMRVLFKNNKNKTINVALSLKGLSKAYDQLDVELK